MRVHRVYFRGGLYTDQVAAGTSAARLYAERLFHELGASVKTECMMLQVDGRRTHVDPKLDRSFLLLVGPRCAVFRPGEVQEIASGQRDRRKAQLAIDIC